MNPTLRNVLALVAGVTGGSLVNMALILVSGKIIPPPTGAGLSDMETLKASMHLFEPRHFLFPFLAHAVGTLAGAFVAASLAATRKMVLAVVVGVLFLAGGVWNAFALPAPAWFKAVDLLGAYFPMAWLGGRLGGRRS